MQIKRMVNFISIVLSMTGIFILFVVEDYKAAAYILLVSIVVDCLSKVSR